MSGLIVLLVSLSTAVPGSEVIDSRGDSDGVHGAAKKLRQAVFEKGMETCRGIDEKKYVTGLLFNGSGMHTYYERAYCFRELAVRERDASLCRFVKRRHSVFFNGSQVSTAVCKQKVAALIQKDQDEAFILAGQRGEIIKSAEVIGILEYEQVTGSRSLILRGKFNALDWPYYHYEFLFQNRRGEMLARYTKSPFGQNQNDRVFIFHMKTLKDDIAEYSLNDISAIVVRAVLERHAESAHVMDHINFDQVDTFAIRFSAFSLIPFLGTIKHDQWIGLQERKQRAISEFIDELARLTGP